MVDRYLNPARCATTSSNVKQHHCDGSAGVEAGGENEENEEKRRSKGTGQREKRALGMNEASERAG